MADTTTITFDGELLSPEQQKKIVKPIQDLLKGLQRQTASAGKAVGGGGGAAVVGGREDDPIVPEERKPSGLGRIKQTLQSHGITRQGLTSMAFGDTPIANLAGDLAADAWNTGVDAYKNRKAKKVGAKAPKGGALPDNVVSMADWKKGMSPLQAEEDSAEEAREGGQRWGKLDKTLEKLPVQNAEALVKLLKKEDDLFGGGGNESIVDDLLMFRAITSWGPKLIMTVLPLIGGLLLGPVGLGILAALAIGGAAYSMKDMTPEERQAIGPGPQGLDWVAEQGGEEVKPTKPAKTWAEWFGFSGDGGEEVSGGEDEVRKEDTTRNWVEKVDWTEKDAEALEQRNADYAKALEVEKQINEERDAFTAKHGARPFDEGLLEYSPYADLEVEKMYDKMTKEQDAREGRQRYGDPEQIKKRLLPSEVASLQSRAGSLLPGEEGYTDPETGVTFASYNDYELLLDSVYLERKNKIVRKAAGLKPGESGSVTGQFIGDEYVEGSARRVDELKPGEVGKATGRFEKGKLLWTEEAQKERWTQRNVGEGKKYSSLEEVPDRDMERQEKHWKGQADASELRRMAEEQGVVGQEVSIKKLREGTTGSEVEDEKSFIAKWDAPDDGHQAKRVPSAVEMVLDIQGAELDQLAKKLWAAAPEGATEASGWMLGGEIVPGTVLSNITPSRPNKTILGQAAAGLEERAMDAATVPGAGQAAVAIRTGDTNTNIQSASHTHFSSTPNTKNDLILSGADANGNRIADW